MIVSFPIKPDLTNLLRFYHPVHMMHILYVLNRP